MHLQDISSVCATASGRQAVSMLCHGTAGTVTGYLMHERLALTARSRASPPACPALYCTRQKRSFWRYGVSALIGCLMLTIWWSWCVIHLQACHDARLLHQMLHCFGNTVSGQQLQPAGSSRVVSHQLDGLNPDGASEPTTPQGMMSCRPSE